MYSYINSQHVKNYSSSKRHFEEHYPENVKDNGMYDREQNYTPPRLPFKIETGQDAETKHSYERAQKKQHKEQQKIEQKKNKSCVSFTL
jgi:hypothetical protein